MIGTRVAEALRVLTCHTTVLQVNGVDVRWATREEAVQLLMQLQSGPVQLLVQAAREQYEEVVSSQTGDSFHVRAHFSYEPPSGGSGGGGGVGGGARTELAVHPGEVFRVVDTLHALGSWLAFRLGRNQQEIQRGLIPNAARAEELAAQQARRQADSGGGGRTSFFRRRRRAARARSPWGDDAGGVRFYYRIVCAPGSVATICPWCIVRTTG